MPEQLPVVIIGAGPAGLTAAHELAECGHPPVVFERDGLVGGLARTNNYKGFYFDMGGHRFFTKSQEVKELWQRVLGNDFLLRPRISRIYYRRRYYAYPLQLLDVVKGLGVLESGHIMLSYLCSKLRPYAPENSFSHWVSNRFGVRLFETFFRSYTEKVWGISADELDAEWAAQRIKNLSLRSAIMAAIIKPGERITSLIEHFHYPSRGPGMMWEAMRNRIEAMGGTVHLNSGVHQILREGDRVTGVVVAGHDGPRVVRTTHVISSMPLPELISNLTPAAPTSVRQAASRLRHRDFLTVCLIVNRANLFPDNWIYIHEPNVRVARIQNFKNWSPDMVPYSFKTSLGLEYFCNEGDELWKMPDEELIDLSKRELDWLGLADSADVEDGCVFRMAKSYPVYDSRYREFMTTVREYVTNMEGLQTIGRNGLHRYNNQDHAMLTGLLAARNVLYGAHYDLWQVNADQNYHEELRVPKPVAGRGSSPASATGALGTLDVSNAVPRRG